MKGNHKMLKSKASSALFIFLFSHHLHCIRQLRRGGDCASQAGVLVNGDRHQEEGLARHVLEIWSSRLSSFFFKWPCSADFYASPLYSLAVIGWAFLVSNLCHLDECVPPPVYVALTNPSLPPATVCHMNLGCSQSNVHMTSSCTKVIIKVQAESPFVPL